MLVLNVTITDGSGRFEFFSLGTSPLRIGRSPLNDLVVDFPFVSQFHGVLRFNERGVTYVDLGSRNSTRLDGQLVPANKPVEVKASSEMCIGPLRFSFARLEATDAPDDQVWPYFGPSRTPPTARGAADAAPRATVVLPDRPADDGAAVAQPAAPELAAEGVLSGHRQPETAREVARWEPARYIPPELAQAPAVHSPTGPGRGVTPPATLADRLSALLDRPENRDDVELILGLAEIAEVAARSVIALRASDESVGEELGVRTVHQQGRARERRSPKELLDHLLFGEGRRSVRIRELATTFSDAGIHQVALLGAIRKGVEDFLGHLHPVNGAFERKRGAIGLFGLKEYTAFFEEETDDPWARILGDGFARAYAVATDERTTGKQDRVLPAEAPSAVPVQNETVAFDGPSPAAASGFPSTPDVPPAPVVLLPAAPPPPTLLVMSPELRGARFVLEGHELTLGRTEDNGIALPHKSVSSRHAVVAQEAGTWTIADLHSTNGVLVNGRKCSKAALQHGDTIQVGRIQLRFSAADTAS